MRPLALVALLLAGNVQAANLPSDFDAANRLYDEGKYSDAAAAYDKILQSGQVSLSLYYNYGNAEFKAGQLGRAIAAYRRAAQFAPRDPDVRANLEFARGQVQGPSLRDDRWSHVKGWLDTLTLNEWAAWTAGAFWLTFLLLAAGQLRPSLRPALRRFTFVAGFAAVLLGAGLGVSAANELSSQTAVVVVPDALARSGPFAEAQSVFTVRDGAELTVLDRRNDWYQVTDGTQRIGWLERQQVEVLPGN